MGRKIVILDNIRSMQNVGAIFRSADGAGFETLYLTGFTPHPPRSDIAKTALGAEKTVFWEYYEDPLTIVKKLKAQGVQILCLEVSPQAKDYKSYFGKEVGDIAIIVGNEVTGVAPELVALADEHIMIPMLGKKTSLNVSVAAGIVMYSFI